MITKQRYLRIWVTFALKSLSRTFHLSVASNYKYQVLVLSFSVISVTIGVATIMLLFIRLLNFQKYIRSIHTVLFMLLPIAGIRKCLLKFYYDFRKDIYFILLNLIMLETNIINIRSSNKFVPFLYIGKSEFVYYSCLNNSICKFNIIGKRTF